MRNTLSDLNNALFCQLERLNDEELKGENLREEIERAKSIKDISQQIISNANTVLRAEEFKTEVLGRRNTNIPKMLGE